MNRKFLGSTIVLILGILSFGGSISQIAKGNPDAQPLVGEVMILGSLAYKSLKKRKLGIARSNKYRQIFEIISMVLILALVVLQKDFMMQLVIQPVANFVIPLWAFIAYGVLFFKKPSASSHDTADTN